MHVAILSCFSVAGLFRAAVPIIVFVAQITCPADAHAATYYVSTSGVDTNSGSQSSPWSTPQKCVETAIAGDTCVVGPGTYISPIVINNKGGTAAAPITLRAQTPAVSCHEPTDGPDGCTVNTSSRTILNYNGGATFTIYGPAAAYWNIEGFEISNGQLAECSGSSATAGPHGFALRSLHVHSATNTGAIYAALFSRCRDFIIENSYFYHPGPNEGNPDYGIALYAGSGVTLRNLWMGGKYHHSMSLKRGMENVTIERLICEGGYECLNLGQNPDDADRSSGGAQCLSVQRADGTVGPVYDSTSRNIMVRDVFARPADDGAMHHSLAFGVRISNVANADIRNVFVANNDNGAAQGLRHDDGGLGRWPAGQCGIEPGRNTVRGMISVSPAGACVRIGGTGYEPGYFSVQNLICHGAPSGVLWSASGTNGDQVAWETGQHPVTVLRNSVFLVTNIFSGNVAPSRITESNNIAWSVATSRPGYATANPFFAGPLVVPNGVLDFGDGQALWDWTGRYQPIIKRFWVTNETLIDAGYGNSSPCTGPACDIGANEFFGSGGGSDTAAPSTPVSPRFSGHSGGCGRRAHSQP